MDRVPRGSRLDIEVTYRRPTTPTTDESSVTITFAERPLREIRHRTIPCGVQTVDADIDVLAVTPAAAAGGDSIEIVAVHGAQRIEPLCIVPRFQRPWAATYRSSTGS